MGGTYEVADFAAHKAKYGKSYSAKEDIMRNAEYLKTVAKINNHNAEYDQGKHTWWMAENAHMDWTAEELEARLGLETRNMPVTARWQRTHTWTGPLRSLRPGLDWRQGICQSPPSTLKSETLPTLKIGVMREQSTQLRIRDSADPAGLSPPSPPLRDRLPSRTDSSPIALSSSWLTVTPVAVAAVVDS